MILVDRPNLPNGNVKHLIAGGLTQSVKNELSAFHIEVIEPFKDISLPKYLNFHSDMLYHYFGNGKMGISEGQKAVCPVLGKLGINDIHCIRLGNQYPLDVKLNVCTFGSNVIINLNTADKTVVDFYKKNGYNIINVKQGYSKCAVAVIDDCSVITEDEGIYSAVLKHKNIDILKIKKGYVRLNGYDCGFIGGAAGKISDRLMFINGDIKKHPDFDNISAFLKQHNVDYVCLSSAHITDIGGIIPLTIHKEGEVTL